MKKCFIEKDLCLRVDTNKFESANELIAHSLNWLASGIFEIGCNLAEKAHSEKKQLLR